MAPATDYSQKPSCSFSEYETDFPHLNAKFEKRAVKGRRSKLEQYVSDIGRHYGSITKFIDDPKYVLSQKRKNRLLKNCADNMAVGVQYSLNRKNRWELEPSDLLENLESSDHANVLVTKNENAMNRYYGYFPRCKALHIMDKDGMIKSASTRGIGVHQSTLLKATGTLDNENESVTPEKGNIVYLMETQTKKDRIFFHRTEKKRTERGRSRNPRRNKLVDMFELELSEMEMENSVHLEENETYKPRRDFKFSLGDFINASTTVPVNIRRQSIESIKNIEEIDRNELPKESRPFDIIDISSVTNSGHVYEKTSISTVDWVAYNFCQQVDALSADEKIVVKWLDPSHLRASIDVSRKLRDNCEVPEMFIILDRCSRGSIGVLLNTTITAIGSPMNESILKNILTHQKSGSVDDVVRILINLVLEWKIRSNNCSATEDSALSEFIFKSMHTSCFTKPAVVVSQLDMAEILRSEADNSEDEPFERISNDEFSSEEDSQGFETTRVGTIKIKCAICEHPNTEDLFEMDDCWQCIECARQTILIQIKRKYLPIDAPFVTDADTTPYDVLPAILPLPIFNFYTKVAALEILENSQDEINDLFECPKCCNVVKVERPHEYSSCCCSRCSTTWCTECKNEPHWPLTCSEFANWSDKWFKQYPNGVPRIQTTRFPKKFTCECHVIATVKDTSVETLFCTRCYKTNDPSMIVMPLVKYCPKRKRMRGVNELPRIHRPVQLIRKDIADICADARLQRFTKPKAKTMKAIRSYKNIPTGQIYDLRRTILLLVEYGLAKLYFTKKGPQGLKASVLQLLRKLDELIADVEGLKTSVNESVKQLDIAVNKVVEQFKIIDLV